MFIVKVFTLYSDVEVIFILKVMLRGHVYPYIRFIVTIWTRMMWMYWRQLSEIRVQYIKKQKQNDFAKTKIWPKPETVVLGIHLKFPVALQAFHQRWSNFFWLWVWSIHFPFSYFCSAHSSLWDLAVSDGPMDSQQYTQNTYIHTHTRTHHSQTHTQNM